MHANFRLYEDTLRSMEVWHAALSASVPQPVLVPFGDSHVYRHIEQTPQQAIVQKLARIVSGLDAAHLLLLRGLFQEQGAMQRILDELDEDAMFLSNGLIHGWTDRHAEFLEAFFQEEFDNPQDPANSTQNRPMPRRDKIRAFIAKMMGGGDPSGAIKATRTLSKGYSGFVHAASPHIMDMYDGDPPRFHLRGMLGTGHASSHLHDIWNSFYRGVMTYALAAHALGNLQLANKIMAFKLEFERLSGRHY